MIKDIDFGEIIIDGIPKKTIDATRVMSFNLRYCDDEEGSVKNRSVISKAIIEQYSPDSVGVQEATGEWMDILTSGLENYAYVGEHRDKDANGPIDYAFVSKNVKVDRYKIIRNTVMDIYPSDHYPIIVDVIF